MSETRSGRCSCGTVTYEVTGDPLITHACHCSYCQRETGGAFVVNLLFEAHRVAMKGDPDKIDTPSESGQGQIILRCPDCGVAVSSHYPKSGEKIHFVRAGTLDDISDVKPDAHIYCSADAPWLKLDDGIPQFPEFYDPRSFWSDEQMERWKKAVHG